MSRDGEFEAVTLRDGQRTIRHVGFGEVMHPGLGPWAEANRLYVEQPRLRRLLERADAPPLVVFDVGMGAAANASAVLSAAKGLPRQLELVSFERDLAPLRLALADREGFPYLEPWRDAVGALLERGEWSGENLHWRLLLGDLRPCLERERAQAELVLFDPFSPNVQPELWSPTALRLVRERCRLESPGALLVTYSGATPTRVSLLLAGFFVGVGIGVGTKRETTLAATRPELLERPLGAEWLERWRRSSSQAPHGEPAPVDLEKRLASHPQFGRG